MPWMARVPALYNGLMRSGWVRAVLERHVGMVDSPLLSRFDLAAVIRQWQVKPADPQALAALSDAQRARSVVIVQDTFTRYFDTEQLATLIELAARMGFQVWLAPLAPNGKALHVQGFLRAFEQAAIRNATQLAALARSGVALVGLDPAMTLTYRQEYLKVTKPPMCRKLRYRRSGCCRRCRRLVLATVSAACPRRTGYRRTAPRRPMRPTAASNGQVFARRGLRLKVQATGCCGMSGTYGHEARNLATSKTIYAQSWASHVDGPEDEGEALATGYSCRSQVKRMSSKQVRHPLQALLDHMRAVGDWSGVACRVAREMTFDSASSGKPRAVVDACLCSGVGFRRFSGTWFSTAGNAPPPRAFGFDPHLPDHAPEIDLVRSHRADQFRDDREVRRDRALARIVRDRTFVHLDQAGELARRQLCLLQLLLKFRIRHCTHDASSP